MARTILDWFMENWRGLVEYTVERGKGRMRWAGREQLDDQHCLMIYVSEYGGFVAKLYRGVNLATNIDAEDRKQLLEKAGEWISSNPPA